MVIKFFKSQQPLAYFIMAIITFFIWSICFFITFSINSGNAMPFYNLLISIITPEKKIFYFLFGFALIDSQAIHLNIVVNKNEVLYRNSFLPGLFYLLLMCIIPPFISFHPVLIVNSILIFVIDKIFRLYKNDSPLALDFDICVLLSIMTMIYLPSAIFILLYIIGLLILRPFSWRDWIVGALGFITPVFFVLLYYFLNDRLYEIKNLIFAAGITSQFNIKNVVPAGYSLTIIWVVTIFVLSVVKIRGNFYKNAAKTRNYQQLILLFLVISLLMIIFTPAKILYRFSILCIPLSVIISYYFLAAKKAWLNETLFIIFIVIMIYNFIYTL